MKIERILFATDFSECSDTALEFASRLANECNALLYIVHVEENAASDDSAGAVEDRLSTTINSDHREIQNRLRHMRPTIPRVAYKVEHVSGLPVTEILKKAEQEEVDAIVVGSHGRTGLAKLLMGSVAEGVMRRALCPVLVVKTPICAVEDVSAAVLDNPPG